MHLDPVAIGHVAHWVAQHVTPLLPVLTEKAAEGVAKGTGEVWVKSAWEKLYPKVEANALAKAAVEASAAAPEDKDNQKLAEMALERLIKKDPALAEQLHALLPSEAKAAITQIVIGDQNITTSGTVTGNVFVTGNKAKLNTPDEKPKGNV